MPKSQRDGNPGIGDKPDAKRKHDDFPGNGAASTKWTVRQVDQRDHPTDHDAGKDSVEEVGIEDSLAGHGVRILDVAKEDGVEV